ncbi:hypothetical protein H8959_021290 [Pygathrix nigripes]
MHYGAATHIQNSRSHGLETAPGHERLERGVGGETPESPGCHSPAPPDNFGNELLPLSGPLRVVIFGAKHLRASQGPRMNCTAAEGRQVRPGGREPGNIWLVVSDSTCSQFTQSPQETHTLPYAKFLRQLSSAHPSLHFS